MNTRKCTGDFLKDSYSERLESPKNLGGDMWAYKGDYCGTASRLVFFYIVLLFGLHRLVHCFEESRPAGLV